MNMNVDWNRFREVISAANKIVLTSHIRPDCDALGTCLGLAGLLEGFDEGKGVAGGALSLRGHGAAERALLRLGRWSGRGALLPRVVLQAAWLLMFRV